MGENKTMLVDSNNGKTVALVAYLTIIGLVIALVMNNKAATGLGRFHIRQSIGISLTAIVSTVVRFVPGVGNILASVIGIVILVALVLGILSAIKGEEKPLPFVGNLYQKWFSMI